MALTECKKQKGNGRMNVVTMQYIRAMEFLRTLRDREEGQGMVEYGLILSLVALVAAAGFAILGEDIESFIKGIAESLGA